MGQIALLHWAASLEDSWSLYATMTFRRPTRTTNAVMKLRSWLSPFMTGTAANRRALSVRRILYSVEPHKSGNAHIHALLEISPGPFLGHCKRCAHSPGSCDRVRATVVDRKTGIPREQVLRHGAWSTDALWKQLNESWACHFGWARFEPYQASLKFGALQYVLKYILSEEMLDWGYETGTL